MCSLSGIPELRDNGIRVTFDIWQILSRSCGMPRYKLLSMFVSGKCGRSCGVDYVPELGAVKIVRPVGPLHLDCACAPAKFLA
jgi:hypothetical protein